MPKTLTDQLDSLFRSEGSWMTRRAARIVGSSQAADVVQDTFERLWERTRDSVVLSPAYLARCLRNATIDHYRREARHAALQTMLLPEQIMGEPTDPQDALIAAEALRRLQGALAAMPARRRQVFLLNRSHGCTYDEIAAALDLSYSTVEREIARALVACRAAMDPAEMDPDAAAGNRP